MLVWFTVIYFHLATTVRQTHDSPLDIQTTRYTSREYSISLIPVTTISTNTCLYYWIKITANYRSNEKLLKDKNSAYIKLLLLIGGIERNPGPRTPKYPCAICDKACRWGQKALACDECNNWYHAPCTGIESKEYSSLANISASWYCVVCNAPNHSTVLYDLIDSADSNHLLSIIIMYIRSEQNRFKYII